MPPKVNSRNRARPNREGKPFRKSSSRGALFSTDLSVAVVKVVDAAELVQVDQDAGLDLDSNHRLQHKDFHLDKLYCPHLDHGTDIVVECRGYILSGLAFGDLVHWSQRKNYCKHYHQHIREVIILVLASVSIFLVGLLFSVCVSLTSPFLHDTLLSDP